MKYLYLLSFLFLTGCCGQALKDDAKRIGLRDWSDAARFHEEVITFAKEEFSGSEGIMVDSVRQLQREKFNFRTFAADVKDVLSFCP